MTIHAGGGDETAVVGPTAAPTLSVLVPAHNVQSWIGETLESLLGQDLHELEVVVVDDHSSDGTRDIVARFAERDPRVVLVDAEQRGGAAARNTAVLHARGRYLAFCDADDLVPPGGYRALVASLETSGSDLAFGDFLKFSPTKTWRPTAGWPAYQEPRSAVRLVDHPSLLRGRAVWNKVFRADFWRDLGVEYPETVRSNDIVPMVTSYLAASRVDVVPEVVYLYRERPGTSSMTARASSAASVLAYLRQELACAALIADADDPGLGSTYAGIFYEADGWKHLSEHLAAPCRDDSADAQISDAVAGIMALLPEFRFNRLAPSRRAIFDLARRHRLETASALVRLVERRPPHEPDHLALWTLALDGLRESGHTLAARDAVRMLTPVLAEQIRTGAESDDPELVRLVRSAESASDGDPWRPLHRIPEFEASRTVPDDTLLRRIRASRAVAHRLAHVRVERGRVTLSGTSRSGEVGLRLRASTAAGGLRSIPASQRRTVDGASEWSATISRRSRLPVGVRLQLVAGASEPGSGPDTAIVAFPTSVRFSTPYDRFAGFVVGRTGEGGIWLERRPHWSIRGARRAARALRSRMAGAGYPPRRPVTSSSKPA